MPNFTIKPVPDVWGKRPAFYRLLVDNKCVIEQFRDECESKYNREIGSMYAIMSRVANGERLPYYDFKFRTDLNDFAFEVKTPNLRFYGMKYLKQGNVIILCGYKNSQKKDERKIDGLIKAIIRQKPIPE